MNRTTRRSVDAKGREKRMREEREKGREKLRIKVKGERERGGKT